MLVIGLLFSVALTVHFVYFRRPPTVDILNANRRRHTSTLQHRHTKQQPQLQEPTQKEPLLQKPLQQPPQQKQLLENIPQQQKKLLDNLRQSQPQQIAEARLQKKQQLLWGKQDKDNGIIKQVDGGQELNDHLREQTTTAKTKTAAADVITSVKEWEDWITFNEFVSIGDIYNKCDGDNRLQVGKVILLEDKANGGVKTRTFVNATFPDGVFGGELYIKSSYNGRELYHNQWDVCTVEEDMDDQVIECPLDPGVHNFVKDIKIPNYLPKGTYTSRAWVVNENEVLMGCSLTSFTI